ncbi:GNAT family N-acetyltransferase [Paenibacillus marinisediminis]
MKDRMNKEFEIADCVELGAEHASLIAELQRNEDHVPTYSYFITSCIGYERYVRNLLEEKQEHRNTWFIGIMNEGLLAGYAEWRLIDDILHLNQLLIHPIYRGKGIGKILMLWGTSYAKERHLPGLSLDVFVSNARALSWYERLGFVPREKTAWYVQADVRSVESGAEPVYSLINHDQSEQMHNNYHFSSLCMTTPSGTYRIGRIGTDYYRISEIDALYDDDLIAGLRQLDPRRAIVVMIPEDLAIPSMYSLVDVSMRMMRIEEGYDEERQSY